MNPLLYIITFAVSAYVLLSIVQPRPSFILLLPILLLTIGIGWYLNKHIQKEHEDNLKKDVEYTLEEENATHWLHQSFIPKTNILLKNHIKEIIFYTGIVLLLFIFAWSYLVAGLTNAILSVCTAAILYSLFVFYTLHADKWYKYFFKHIPKQYKHFQKNNWIHGYVILLPFTFICFVIYLLFNYNGAILTLLLGIPVFILAYTLFFLALYSGSYLYREYRKDELENAEESLREYLKEEKN